MRVMYLLVTVCVAMHAMEFEKKLTEKREEVLSVESFSRLQKLKEFKDFLQQQDLESGENQEVLARFFTRLQQTADWYNTAIRAWRPKEREWWAG